MSVDLTRQTIPSEPLQEVLVLVGRDILAHMVLIWKGPGGFWTVGY